MTRLLITGTIAALASLSVAGPASARIVCEENYQIIQGQRHSTPYCEDNYLAVVAREYGMNPSAAKIRNNPNYKRDVCRLVGRDIRVQQACSSVDEQRGPRGR